MIQNTHLKINTKLCGDLITIETGYAKVALQCTQEMCADDEGLIHGGFIFGAADFAAMCAVNLPHVVLTASSCRFIAPSSVGDVIEFEAEVVASSAPKGSVEVIGKYGDKTVFSGTFKTYVTDAHVLKGS